MPRLNIRRRRRAIDLHARSIRRKRLVEEARQTVALLKATGVARHQSVVLLIFDPVEGDVTGYMNVDPILAALALVDYLEQPSVDRDPPPGSSGPRRSGYIFARPFFLPPRRPLRVTVARKSAAMRCASSAVPSQSSFRNR
jgi:hypothetical protein